MVIHHDAESVLRRIDKYFKLNPSSIGNTDIYLGARLKNTRERGMGMGKTYQQDMSRNWYQMLISILLSWPTHFDSFQRRKLRIPLLGIIQQICKRPLLWIKIYHIGTII